MNQFCGRFFLHLRFRQNWLTFAPESRGFSGLFPPFRPSGSLFPQFSLILLLQLQQSAYISPPSKRLPLFQLQLRSNCGFLPRVLLEFAYFRPGLALFLLELRPFGPKEHVYGG